jgi:hypothetical protein
VEFPFISRTAHNEVCALYDKHIAELKLLVQGAEKRVSDAEIERRAATDRAFDFATQRSEKRQDREVPTPPRRKTPAKPAESPFDPADPRSLVEQAMKETGSRNRRIVMARVARLRAQYSQPGVAVARAQPEPFEEMEVSPEFAAELEQIDNEAKEMAQQVIAKP